MMLDSSAWKRPYPLMFDAAYSVLAYNVGLIRDGIFKAYWDF